MNAAGGFDLIRRFDGQLRRTPRSIERIWAPLGLHAGSFPFAQLNQYRMEVLQILRHVWDDAYQDYLPRQWQRFFARPGVIATFELEIMRFQNYLPAPVLAMQGTVNLGARLVDLLRYEIRLDPQFRIWGTAIPVMTSVLPAAWAAGAPPVYPAPGSGQAILPSGLPGPAGDPLVPVGGPLPIKFGLPSLIQTAHAIMPGTWGGPPPLPPPPVESFDSDESDSSSDSEEDDSEDDSTGPPPREPKRKRDGDDDEDEAKRPATK
jgi:hypothetical protein